MTANPISAQLRACQDLHNVLRALLEETLALANTPEYHPDWIAAIAKALADNEESWSHINNIATMIELVAPPIPHQE